MVSVPVFYDMYAFPSAANGRLQNTAGCKRKIMSYKLNICNSSALFGCEYGQLLIYSRVVVVSKEFNRGYISL